MRAATDGLAGWLRSVARRLGLGEPQRERSDQAGSVLDGVGEREISPEVTADAAGIDAPEER